MSHRLLQGAVQAEGQELVRFPYGVHQAGRTRHPTNLHPAALLLITASFT